MLPFPVCILMYFAAFKISATRFEDLVASLPHFAAFWPLQFHRLPTAWCEMPWRVPRRFLQHLQQFQLLPPGRQVLRAFLRSCRQPARQSARFNRLKASNEATKAWFLSQQWNLDAVKWCSSGWFLSRKDQDLDLQVFKQPIGKSLPHFLGYLYSQDAASMLPAEVLKALLDGISGNSQIPCECWICVQHLVAKPSNLLKPWNWSCSLAVQSVQCWWPTTPIQNEPWDFVPTCYVVACNLWWFQSCQVKISVKCLAFFMQFWWMLHAQLKQMFAEIVECWTDGGFRSSPKPTWGFSGDSRTFSRVHGRP